ncbi:LrgB family protein [Pseudomonas sp. NyZ704]|nr:LrgB family protein [Pseudomonas sp. NyZ704]
MSGSLLLAWQAIMDHPLFWVGVTLAAYQSGVVLYERSGMAVFHPVLVSILLLIGIILLLGGELSAYHQSVTPLMVLIGPATVALAVPLYVNLKRIREFLSPVLITLLVGGTLATLATIVIAWGLRIEHSLVMTMAPKSVTTPIAMLVAEQTGGIAALAAVFVMITAVIAAVFGPWLLRIVGVRSEAAWGLSMGICAHAIGTALSLERSKEAGAFAALGMSLMGITTAILLPLAVTVWVMV